MHVTRKGELGCLLVSVLSPIVVRKPPRESSSGSVARSLARTPISVLAESSDFWNFAVHVPGGGGWC